ncbi:MAG TPA: hypothetical protein VM686_42260 [Polyangiaceae bacterium]|nr:hypothetical protein [Polyangiaceae bacterium]
MAQHSRAHRALTRSVATLLICSLPAGLLSVGCDSGNVGDPCTPDAEYSLNFAPFSVREVYLESRSLQCATRLCLVNHFQGRVSCPLGQASSDDPERVCTTPDGAERIEGEVPAWDLDRSAERSVYCSCRCDGPDPDGRYCECPSGFECQKLAPEVGFENRELAGSYCIKNGSAFAPAQVGGATCADAPTDARCAP